MEKGEKVSKDISESILRGPEKKHTKENAI